MTEKLLSAENILVSSARLFWELSEEACPLVPDRLGISIWKNGAGEENDRRYHGIERKKFHLGTDQLSVTVSSWKFMQ